MDVAMYLDPDRDGFLRRILEQSTDDSPPHAFKPLRVSIFCIEICKLASLQKFDTRASLMTHPFLSFQIIMP